MRRFAIWTGIVLLAIVTLLGAVAAYYSRDMKGRVIRALEQRFNSKVELGQIYISLFPNVSLIGDNLVVRHKGRTDIPPFLSIRRFSLETSLMNLLRSPKRVRSVQLEGLQIHVPPKEPGPKTETQQPKQIFPFEIHQIIADGTSLVVLTNKPGKEPLTFDLYRLVIESPGPGQAMSFRTLLSNPTPPGMIQSTGEFGPWQADEPSTTPVSGSYEFEHADLSVFNGIGGTLSSVGDYRGALDEIEVQGETDTPDFYVASSGNRVHLRTKFQATVDGTNGDTFLHPVEASFLNTTLQAKGRIEGQQGVKGKEIVLDVATERARVEDLIRLVLKGNQSFITGVARFQTKFDLPPGEEDIVKRLKLDAQFRLNDAHFASKEVQEKLAALSRRGRGEPDEAEDRSVVSNMQGKFVLGRAKVNFSSLSFSVPGAAAALTGDYDLASEEIDFHGALSLQATLSETTTGVKSVFLRLIDPLFKRHGAGTYLPIKITGTRENPAFAVDRGRLFSEVLP